MHLVIFVILFIIHFSSEVLFTSIEFCFVVVVFVKFSTKSSVDIPSFL